MHFFNRKFEVVRDNATVACDSETHVTIQATCRFQVRVLLHVFVFIACVIWPCGRKTSCIRPLVIRLSHSEKVAFIELPSWDSFLYVSPFKWPLSILFTQIHNTRTLCLDL